MIVLVLFVIYSVYSVIIKSNYLINVPIGSHRFSVISIRLNKSLGSRHAIFKTFLAELIVYGSFKGI